MLPDSKGVTLGEWLDYWLKTYAKIKVRSTTYENYEMFIRVHLKPALGDMKLHDITTNDIQQVYNQKLKEGRTDGRGGLSPRSIHIMHTILNQAFRRAKIPQKLYINPATDCVLPSVSKKPKARVLRENEQARYIKAVSQSRYGTAFLLFLGTGLRRGEMLGLKWENVDLDNGTIYIQQQLLQVKEDDKYQLGYYAPKSEKSIRQLPLPKWAIDLLKKHKEKQNKEKRDYIEDNGLVFCTTRGTPINPSNFWRDFKKVLHEAQLPDIRIHDLRHTFATRLLEKGVAIKVIQELMGHSQFSLTADTYTQVLDGLKRKAIQKLDNSLDSQ